ncbi:hypothetical protein Trydic_g16044 [Trypoxylus dichotomus]
MPSKKKKYNARFPASRIKKIMQTDEEVGKVAQAVPVIISRTLELFVESLLTKSMQITQSRNAKTLTPSHMKQCILSENRFDFLKDLVKDIPDASVQEDNENNALELDVLPKSYDLKPSETHNTKGEIARQDTPANFYTEQSTSTARTPVIQYGPNVKQAESQKINFPVDEVVKTETKLHIDLTHVNNINKQHIPVPDLVPTRSNKDINSPLSIKPVDNIPSLIPISQNYCGQGTGDSLYIDEDYDN